MCFDVKELVSIANFPGEMAALSALVERINDFNVSRGRLAAEAASGTLDVKAVVTRVEVCNGLISLTLCRMEATCDI